MDGGCQGPATEAPPGRELLGVQPAGPPRREVGPASAAVTARTTREGPAQRLQPDAGGGPTAPLPHELLPPIWPRRRRGERPPPRRTASACPCALPGPEEGGGVTAPSSRRAQPAPCRGRTSRDQPEHRVRHSRARESPDLGAGPRGPGWLPACRGGAGADAPRHARPPRAAGSLRQPGRGGRGQGGGRGAGTGADRDSGAEEQGATLVPVPQTDFVGCFSPEAVRRPRRPLRKGRAGVGDAWGRARLARPPSAPAAWALGRGPRGRGSRGTASRAAPPAAAARYN